MVWGSYPGHLSEEQRLKVNGYFFRGINSSIFSVAPPPSPLERILSCKSRPHFEKTSSSKQTGSHENCLPLQTWQKKREVYLYTLIQSVNYYSLASNFVLFIK